MRDFVEIEVMSTNYLYFLLNNQNKNSILGKYIPASQRPDGTWRKARRVKNGYVPQEEVPLYESKGKQFMKKPALPVGMCPIVAQEAKQKREKQQQKQEQSTKKTNSIPGLIQLPSCSSSSATQKPKQSSGKSKEATENASKTNKSTAGGTANTTKSSTKSKNISTKRDSDDPITVVSNSISNLNLTTEEEIAKKIKRLRKKIREIEAIEAKLICGELKNPEQDQLDKIGRKKRILNELRELEKQAEAEL